MIKPSLRKRQLLSFCKKLKSVYILVSDFRPFEEKESNSVKLLFANLQGNSIFHCKYFNQGFYTDNNSSKPRAKMAPYKPGLIQAYACSTLSIDCCLASSRTANATSSISFKHFRRKKIVQPKDTALAIAGPTNGI